MNLVVHDQIQNVIAKTKAHRDTFAVPQLVKILKNELAKAGDSDLTHEEIILAFVSEATEAISNSAIHSESLLREFYRNVLDIADQAGLARADILEDLLFQSLRRSADPEKTRKKKQKDVRKRILQVALEEFSEKGFHTATIDSIAERAGIGKGTVYRYFKTKDALFSALKEETISEFLEPARRDLSREEDIVQIIESIIRMYLGFFEKNSAFFKVITQEHREFGRDFSEKFINELILGLPGLKRRCWKASRNGKLKQINYFTVFYGIIGFLNGVIQKWLSQGAERSLLDEVDTVKEVLFYGFAVQTEPTEKTHALKVIS